MERFIIVIIVSLTMGASWSRTVIDPCDIVVDVSHQVPFPMVGRYDISGYFLENDGESWNMKLLLKYMHPTATSEMHEAIRHSNRCRIQGCWLDERRTIFFPQRIDILDWRLK